MSHPPELTRLRDWPERMDALLRERAQAPFVWGRNDCCLFAADMVLALTGHDPMAALRGRYASRRDAMRLLASLGGYTAAITGVLGQCIDARLAVVGDVLLLSNAGRPLLAVCNGTSAVAPGPHGLAAAPVAGALLAAWRVA